MMALLARMVTLIDVFRRAFELEFPKTAAFACAA
jgi:hypothetical protein